MRVLQIIDSLNAGGAERMAVQIANCLHSEIEFSGLCVTRKEGVLKDSVLEGLPYLFARRKTPLDIAAILRVSKFCKQHAVEILHAHSTSYFFAIQLKMFQPKLKIVWHDHYGNSEFLEQRSFKLLKPCSSFFTTVISVNSHLKSWAEKELNCNHVQVVNNFFSIDNNTSGSVVQLKGIKGKRIICLANLRPQKNHLFLIESFKETLNIFPDWSLHLLGAFEEDDEYYHSILNILNRNSLENNVFIYGSVTRVQEVLSQADIGVISSQSEGLPLALIEYGMAKLPVITTNVGQCNEVVNDNGQIVESNDQNALKAAFKFYIENTVKRKADAESYHLKIKREYSNEPSIQQILKVYNASLNSYQS